MATRELGAAPRMAVQYAKAATGMVPGAALLPFVAGRGKEVPDTELVLPDVAIDRDHLAAYDRVCGFPLRDEIPATYPHMLAFPLHMALMTDGKFPFGPVGLVHIANRIAQRRPIRLDERLTLRVRATPLEPHRRGRTFTILTDATVDGEEVWSGASVNLHRDSSGSKDAPREPGPPPEWPPSAEWRLPGDLGRRYGAVSGDRNPIHMHSVSARLFGFPRAIAHGMWTKARCLAALDPRLPPAFTVEVQFRKPILLPGTVSFSEREERFAVRDARRGTAHVDGAVTPG